MYFIHFTFYQTAISAILPVKNQVWCLVWQRICLHGMVLGKEQGQFYLSHIVIPHVTKTYDVFSSFLPCHPLLH
jgi:hypothetical protein